MRLSQSDLGLVLTVGEFAQRRRGRALCPGTSLVRQNALSQAEKNGQCRPSGQFLVVICATGPRSAERSSHGDFLRPLGVDFITVVLPDKMRFADRLLVLQLHSFSITGEMKRWHYEIRHR